MARLPGISILRWRPDGRRLSICVVSQLLERDFHGLENGISNFGSCSSIALTFSRWNFFHFTEGGYRLLSKSNYISYYWPLPVHCYRRIYQSLPFLGKTRCKLSTQTYTRAYIYRGYYLRSPRMSSTCYPPLVTFEAQSILFSSTQTRLSSFER